MDLGRQFKQLLRYAWTRLRREQLTYLAVTKGATLLKGQHRIDGRGISVLYIGSEAVRNDLLVWFKGFPELRGLSRAEALSFLTDSVAKESRSSLTPLPDSMDSKSSEKRATLDRLDAVVIERSITTHVLAGELRPSGTSKLFQSLLDMNITCKGGFDHYLYSHLKKRRRNTIHRALKQPFAFRVSTDKSELEHLYQNLFKPSTLKIHGVRSHLPPLDVFRRALARGELHICEQDGAALVANLVLINRMDAKARLWRQGIDLQLLENPKLRSEATTFTDANTIKYCLENRIPRISFGKSVCLTEDGGFRNKAHWGCLPEIDKFYPFCYLYSLTPTMAEVCTLTGFLDASAVAAYTAEPEEPLKKAG